MCRQLKSDDQSKHKCIVDHGEIQYGIGTSEGEVTKVDSQVRCCQVASLLSAQDHRWPRISLAESHAPWPATNSFSTQKLTTTEQRHQTQRK